MLSFKPLILLVALPYLHCTTHLDWCHYWRELQKDHVKPECNGLYRLRFSKLKDEKVRQLPHFNRDLLVGFHRYKSQVTSPSKVAKRIFHIEMCPSTFTFCKSSTICDSGLLCRSKVNSRTCCAPKRLRMSSCPAPSKMNINCFSKQLPEACTSNLQCFHSSKRECCPSECGFSVCT